MPAFAHVAAHAVIDTMTLLIWHQTVYTHICQESLQAPHLKALVDYYLRQCQPLPIPGFFLYARIISVLSAPSMDTAVPLDRP